MSSSLKKLAAGVLVLAGASAVWGFYYLRGNATAAAKAATEEGVAPADRVTVVVTPAASRPFEEKLAFQANVEARNFAMVAVRVPGTIERFYVDEGDTVVAGQSKLFEIDSVKLAKAVEVREQDLSVARCASREKEANLEAVRADFAKAQVDYERFKRLHERGAVAADALEQQETRFKQASAMVKHAESLVDLGVEQERQAEAALAIARKDLSDSLVYAPISGLVSRRFHEVGENGDVGKPLIRIDDPSVLEVKGYLPSQYYDRVRVNETPMRIGVYGTDAGEHAVTYKSPTIDPQLRTFEVKCVLESPPEGMVPGAMAQVEVILDRRTAVGVPSAAVMNRATGKVLFVVENDVARQVPVEAGLETGGWVECRAEGLNAGAGVVTMGQFLLNDGAAVTVQRRESM